MLIVKDGKAKTCIVTEKDAPEEITEAAADLARVIKKSSGASLKRIKAGSKTDSGGGLRLAVRPELAKASRGGIEPSDVFRISCKGDCLEIAGARPRATAYGAYYLLEKIVGAMWYFPGELGEDIPKKKTISFAAGSKTHKPDFSWRAVGGGNFGEWQIRNRMQSFPINAGHAYGHVIPHELFKEHPEFFPKIFGKRRNHHGQLCHSAPGIVERTLEYIDQEFAKNPELSAVSIGPSDCGFFCECDDCRAMDADVFKYYDYFVNEPPLGYGGPLYYAHLSERVFEFTNQVADGVAERHPGKYVIMLAYGAYRFPPQNMRIRDNIIVWLTSTCVGMWNPERRKIENDMFRMWRKVAKNVVTYEAMANQCWPCIPREVSALAAEHLKQMKRNGVKGYYTQMFGDFATNLPSYHLSNRLLQNPQADPQKELREMYKRVFGPAAKDVARYFKIFEEAWKKHTEEATFPWARSIIATKRQYGMCVQVFTKKVMSDARCAIDKAAASAGGGICGKRVAWLEKGMRFTELIMDVMRECCAMEDMSLPMFYPTPWLSPEFDMDYVKNLILGQIERRVLAHACNRTLKALDKVEAFVRSVEGEHVLSPNMNSRLEKNCRFGETRKILEKMRSIAEAKKADPKMLKKIFVLD